MALSIALKCEMLDRTAGILKARTSRRARRKSRKPSATKNRCRLEEMTKVSSENMIKTATHRPDRLLVKSKEDVKMTSSATGMMSGVW